MRLYLSSHRFGDHFDRFSALVRGARRGVLISNAVDALDAETRAAAAAREIEGLAERGLDAVDLDLRRHDPSSIASAFGEPDFVWVRGGNVFVLRAALARSGADTMIIRMLQRDALAYGGYSAGACVLAPALTGLEHCDPVEECEALYGTVTWEGLGVLDRAVVPHLASPDHPESPLLEAVARSYDLAGRPYWALRDGDALLREDDAYRYLGPGPADDFDATVSRPS